MRSKALARRRGRLEDCREARSGMGGEELDGGELAGGGDDVLALTSLRGTL